MLLPISQLLLWSLAPLIAAACERLPISMGTLPSRDPLGRGRCDHLDEMMDPVAPELPGYVESRGGAWRRLSSVDALPADRDAAEPMEDAHATPDYSGLDPLRGSLAFRAAPQFPFDAESLQFALAEPLELLLQGLVALVVQKQLE